jgi:hypothetical protein
MAIRQNGAALIYTNPMNRKANPYDSNIDLSGKISFKREKI